ncbi:MAG: PKD domain-containing protein, partial [Phaeodactylibacter sp.]|nr:PKD domain-containing protein [Phaeodactylibacter sp.]
WFWEFGDGNTSTDQNPSHSYAAAGLYTVALTIVTADGCSNYYCIFVSVGEGGGWDDCFASFYYFPIDDLTMQFEDWSFGFFAPVVAWEWDFGDGSPLNNEPFPIHSYPDTGMYTVTLTITTQDGCTSSYSEVVYVGVDPGGPCNCPTVWDPVCVTLAGGAVLTFENGCIAECYGYTDYESCDPWGVDCYADFWWFQDDPSGFEVDFEDFSTPDAVSWNWDFGDGAVSTAQNPSHTYAADGEYLVTLTITTADGCTATATYPVWVGDGFPGGPDCQAFFWFELDPDAPLTVTFEDLTVGDVDTWSWDFGDGTTSTEQNPVHTYAAPGIYPVTLSTSSADCSSTFVMLVWTDDGIIYNEDCQALFIPVLNDLEVLFLDLSFGDAIVEWNWDFGDASTSNEIWPVHTYAAEGIYDVVLSITTADGCSSEFSITLDLDEDNFQGNSTTSALVANSTNNLVHLETATLFPNPVNEALQLRYTAQANTNVTISILSLDGKVQQLQNTRSQAGLNQVELNVAALPAGSYLLRLRSEGGQECLKFAKQ